MFLLLLLLVLVVVVVVLSSLLLQSPARTRTTFILFLLYNRSFSSILYGHFINFAVSCFYGENDNLHFFARVASISPKHCFNKNLYTACKNFQLP